MMTLPFHGNDGATVLPSRAPGMPDVNVCSNFPRQICRNAKEPPALLTAMEIFLPATRYLGIYTSNIVNDIA